MSGGDLTLVAAIIAVSIYTLKIVGK